MKVNIIIICYDISIGCKLFINKLVNYNLNVLYVNYKKYFYQSSF